MILYKPGLKTCQFSGGLTLASPFEQLFHTMVSEWDRAVEHHSRFAPNWKTLTKGDNVSVVVDGLVYI